MSGNRLRYEVLLLALIGAEAAWLSLLSYALGRTEGGGELGWLPLFLGGAALILLNRWLLRRALWESTLGRLLAAGGGIVVISWLFYWVAPQQVGLLVGPDDWLGAITGIWQLFARPVPLTVAALVGVILWLRAANIAQSMTGTEAVGARFQINTLLILLLLAEATFWGRVPSQGMLLLFFGCSILSMALSRTDEIVRFHGNLRFNGPWLSALLGSVLFVLLLGALLAPTAAWIRNNLVPDAAAYAGFYLFALFLHLVGSVLIPLIEGTPRSEITLVPAPSGSSNSDTAGFGALFLLMMIVGALLLAIYFYRLFKRETVEREEQADTRKYGRVEARWGLGGWLQEQGRKLREARLFQRQRFGVDNVRDLYKNLLLLGDEYQLARPSENTPYEYLTPLCRDYPARRDDFFALTDAYVTVRYGDRSFSQEQLRHLQAAWHRIEEELGRTNPSKEQ